MKKLYNLLFIITLSLIFIDSQGQEWDYIRESKNGATLSAISFPDSINGWMVSQNTQDFKNNILQSEDKGETWSEGNSSVEDQYVDVHFFNNLEGFILGSKTLQKTDDGGKTWEQVDCNPQTDSPSFIKLDFIGNTAYILGEKGVLMKSVDKGNTWELKKPVTGGQNFNGFDFVSQDTGVVVGQINGVLGQEYYVTLTTDGGETWSKREIASQTNSVTNDVFYANDTTVYAFGRGGIVLRSDNAGVSWKQMIQIENSTGYFLQATTSYFQSADTGWVAGTTRTESYFEVFRTDDGGITWQNEFKSAAAGKWAVEDIASSKEGVLWICGFSRQSIADTNGDYIIKRTPGQGPPVSIVENSSVLSFKNYPNPFENGTTLELEIRKVEYIQLLIYNSTGQLIKNIYEGILDPGIHTFNFEPSIPGEGLYFSVLKVDGKTITNKLIKN